MTDTDDAIRHELRRHLEQLQVTTQGRAASVRSEHQRRARRRRALTAVGASVLVAAGLSVIHLLGDRHQQEVPEPAVHLRIVRTLSASSLGLVKPEAAVVGPNGRLYITDSVRQTVTETTLAGRVVRRWGGPGAKPGQFRLADGSRIAVDQHGRIYVADSGNGRVQVFTRSGHFIRQLGTFGGQTGQFVYPTAIAVGSDGSVYVSDDSRTTLTRLTATGHQVWRIGGPRTTPDTPADLAGHTHFGSLDSLGRLVVANDDTSRVVYLSPHGQVVDAFGHGKSRDQPSDFPQGSCDTTVDADDYVYVAGCIPSKRTGNLVQIYDDQHRLVGAWTHSPLVTAPRFGPGGIGVAVGYGSVLELRLDG